MKMLTKNLDISFSEAQWGLILKTKKRQDKDRKRKMEPGQLEKARLLKRARVAQRIVEMKGIRERRERLGDETLGKRRGPLSKVELSARSDAKQCPTCQRFYIKCHSRCLGLPMDIPTIGATPTS